MVKPHVNEACRIPFAFGVAFVGVIHPTGSMYLGTLLVAWLVSHRWSAAREYAFRTLGNHLCCCIGRCRHRWLGIFFQNVGHTCKGRIRMAGRITASMFNGPILLGLAGWTLWRFNASFEVWLLSIWIAMQWMLTWVHLLDGMIGISVLTPTSYMLYSMALHAFTSHWLYWQALGWLRFQD